MRDAEWYDTVEQSLMILHAKIDKLSMFVDMQHDMFNVLIDLNKEEEALIDDDPSAS